MMSLIPEQDREYMKLLERQGKLGKNVRVTGNYIYTVDQTDADVTSGSELKFDKYGLYQGLK